MEIDIKPMTITQLINALQISLKHYGDRGVMVHCHGCCLHAHFITGMALGGTCNQSDESDVLVIEV